MLLITVKPIIGGYAVNNNEEDLDGFLERLPCLPCILDWQQKLFENLKSSRIILLWDNVKITAWNIHIKGKGIFYQLILNGEFSKVQMVFEILTKKLGSPQGIEQDHEHNDVYLYWKNLDEDEITDGVMETFSRLMAARRLPSLIDQERSPLEDFLDRSKN